MSEKWMVCVDDSARSEHIVEWLIQHLKILQQGKEIDLTGTVAQKDTLLTITSILNSTKHTC
jgi:hypothetical protein